MLGAPGKSSNEGRSYAIGKQLGFQGGMRMQCERYQQSPGVMKMDDPSHLSGSRGNGTPGDGERIEGLGQTTMAKVGYVASAILFGGGLLCMAGRGPADCCAMTLMCLGTAAFNAIAEVENPTPGLFHVD
jgi:hypothetical protein